MKDSHFYIHATADIRKGIDEMLDGIEDKLRNAYTKQLEAQIAANVKLPALTPENQPVIHGARLLGDAVTGVWHDIAKSYYYFMRVAGKQNAAFAIVDEFRAKGLKIDYY